MLDVEPGFEKLHEADLQTSCGFRPLAIRRASSGIFGAVQQEIQGDPRVLEC